MMWSLAPCTFLTAKQNKVDGSGLPSILKVAKEAAWPSIGWEHYNTKQTLIYHPSGNFNTDFSFDWKQLHSPSHSTLLSTDTNQQQPVLLRIRSIVNNLATVQWGMPVQYTNQKTDTFNTKTTSNLSNILTGCESPSIDQWNTEDSVTKARVLGLIHFQKITSSLIVCAFILDFISILKICKVFWASTPAFPVIQMFNTLPGDMNKSNLLRQSLWMRDS